MYCKKCGRKLRGEARFCDHCGQSTKEVKETKTTKTTKTTKSTSGAKSNSGSKTTSGRSNYGKSDSTRSAYERNKKRRELERQRVKRNRKIALFAILFAIILATVLGFVSYNMMKPVPDENKETALTADSTGEEETENPENAEATEEAEETQETQDEEAKDKDGEKSTPEPTEESEEKAKESESEKEQEKKDYKAVAAECNIYKDDRMDDISCPYPKNFEQGSKANKNTVISLIDPLNDGSMMICAEVVGTGKSPATLMNSYADGLGVKISQSASGDNWYEVSFERNNKTNHRKAVIANGLCVYYDFSYDVDSGEADSYEKYIEYMDYYLEEEAKSLAKEENAKK